MLSLYQNKNYAPKLRSGGLAMGIFNKYHATLILFAASLLGGCGTTGMGVPPAQATAAVPDQPMTQTRAAEICWMATEKGAGSMSLDKRADFVKKCIDEKMKGGLAQR
jgi:hypothetical protein